MNMENKLFGKTMIWNGDSICQGSSRWVSLSQMARRVA